MTNKITEADIEGVLEADSKRTQGDWEAYCGYLLAFEGNKAGKTVYDSNKAAKIYDRSFIAKAPLMIDIIKHQQEQLKEVEERGEEA